MTTACEESQSPHLQPTEHMGQKSSSTTPQTKQAGELWSFWSMITTVINNMTSTTKQISSHKTSK